MKAQRCAKTDALFSIARFSRVFAYYSVAKKLNEWRASNRLILQVHLMQKYFFFARKSMLDIFRLQELYYVLISVLQKA